MKRFAATTILTVALLASVATWADAQSAPVTFSVENNQINLGEIKAGTDAVATFTFHNSGTEAVKIIKAKPS